MLSVAKFLLISIPIVQCIIVPAPEEICGPKLMTSPSGSFTSPFYPLEYLSDQVCDWVIEVEPGNIIEITFNDFELGSGLFPLGDIINDYVLIYENDTKDMGRYFPSIFGHNTYRSKSNKVIVEFVSDEVDEFRGFNASYESWNALDYCEKYTIQIQSVKKARCFDESKYHFYKRCYVTCLEGYVLKKSSKVHCNNGEFLPESPCGLIDFEARLCELTDMGYCLYSTYEMAEYLWNQISNTHYDGDMDDNKSVLDIFPDPLENAPPTDTPSGVGPNSSPGIEASCFDKLLKYNYCARKKDKKYAFKCQDFLKIRKLGYKAASVKMELCFQCRAIGCTNVVYI
ncbi:uncharacterized protein LOC120336809 [Styela clava]